MLRFLLLTISIFQIAFLTTGCLKLDYEQVEVACNVDADCPFGNTCVANRCYPPEIAEIKEQEILDAQDSGSNDGTSDGTQVVDSGSSDGNTDGTSVVDSGSSDGTQVVDSGSSDGTQVVDSGNSDGNTDGTPVVDSGSTDGTSIVDAGSSDGSSDGTEIDSGISNPDPCATLICQNGGECDESSGTCSCTNDYAGDNCEIAPVTGCTDERATNYNSAATVEDAQCTYRVYIDVDMRCSDYDLSSGLDQVLISGLDRDFEDAEGAYGYVLKESTTNNGIYEHDLGPLFDTDGNPTENDIILQEATPYFFSVNVAGWIVAQELPEGGYWTEYKDVEAFETYDTCLDWHPNQDINEYKRTLYFTREDLDNNGNYKMEVAYNRCDSCNPDSDDDGICDAEYPNTPTDVCTGVDQCPDTTGNDASGCLLCAENQYVENNTCIDCPQNTINAAGDNASGENTSCYDLQDLAFLGELITNSQISMNELDLGTQTWSNHRLVYLVKNDYANLLSGSIPLSIGGVSQLETLDLSNQSLTGVIPEELGDLSELQSLTLNDNLLSGPIPTALCSLEQLAHLSLRNNNLEGEIPSCLCDISPQTTFSVGGNMLCPGYPSCIASMSLGEQTTDNCPTAGCSQSDGDFDDGDGLWGDCDNCPNIYNINQEDSDGDGVGNACDNCIAESNSEQVDEDQDGVGNICDNCFDVANLNQSDLDNNGIGDLCDPDADGDDVCDGEYAFQGQIQGVIIECAAGPDTCPYVAGSQTDSDEDDVGDICDTDQDGDGFSDVGRYRDGITAGRAHTARIKGDRSLAIWGIPSDDDDASFGMLPLPALPNLQKIAASEYGMCAIYNQGFIKCWGNNNEYEVTLNHPTTNGWVDVDIAEKHACAVHKSGHAECWANNDVTDSRATLPTYMGEVIEDWVDIEVYNNNSCGLRANGWFFCWGTTDYIDTNELDVSLTSDQNVAWSRFDVGYNHTCAVDTLGVMQCWGYDGDSRVTGITSNQTWADVATGYGHTCGLTVSGDIHCWGENNSGQTTVPTSGDLNTMSHTWLALTAGWNQTCGIYKDLDSDQDSIHIYCWGEDDQEGDDPASYANGATVSQAFLADNCPTIANPTQEDTDGDGIGDACEQDSPFGNTALQFDGVDDIVTILDSDSLYMTTGLTIQAWISPVVKEEDSTIIMKGSYGYGLALGNDSNSSCGGSPILTYWDQGSCDSAIDSTNTYAYNTWQHLVVTVEDLGSALRIYFYIDGVQEGPYTSTEDAIDNGDLDSVLGALVLGIQDGGFNPYGGLMDDVALWNSALSSGAITALYNGGDPLVNTGNYNAASNLVGYWNFNEGTGLTAYDSSGNGNHGTLGNGTAWVCANGNEIGEGCEDTPVDHPTVWQFSINNSGELATHTDLANPYILEIFEDQMVTLDFSPSTDQNTTASSPLAFSSEPVNPGPGFIGTLESLIYGVRYNRGDNGFTHKNGNVIQEDEIDAFYVTATDNDGNTSTITIEVHVEEVNDIPTWSFMPSPTPEDNAVNYNDIISGTVTIIEEADGIADGAAFTPNTLPSNGTLTMGETANQQNQSATVNWTYTPHENYHGSDFFKLQIVDGSGNTETTPDITIEVGCDANFYNHDGNASTACIPCTAQTDCIGDQVLTGDCTQTTSPTCEVPSRFTTSGETITDSSTNLMWTKCEHGKSYNSMDNTCTGSGETPNWCDSHNCNDDVTAYDTGALLITSSRSEALQACSELTLGGYTDWRLPTLSELKTLVYCSSAGPDPVAIGNNCPEDSISPAIDSYFFPNTNDDKFWTANLNTETNMPYYVDFNTGGDGTSDMLMTTSNRVRCVRGEYLDGHTCGNNSFEPGEDCDDSNDDDYDDCTEQCLSRFTGYGAYSVTDNATGLVWQRCVAGKLYFASQADCIDKANDLPEPDNTVLLNYCVNNDQPNNYPTCAFSAQQKEWCSSGPCHTGVNSSFLLNSLAAGATSEAYDACDLVNTSLEGDSLSGWRLPSLAELKSLVYCQNDNPKAPFYSRACDTDPGDDSTIRLDVFPDTFHNVNTWTGQLKAGTTDEAFAVKFDTGGQSAQSLDTTNFVRCVQGPPLNGPASFSGDLSGTTDENVAITGTVDAVDPNTGNHYTNDGSPSFNINSSWAIHTEPENGIANIAQTRVWSYEPDNNFHGEDTFTIQFTDGAGNIETQEINITINDVNTAPTAEDSSEPCIVGQSCTFNAVASDPDAGDMLAYTITSQGIPGGSTSDNRASVDSSGQFTYAAQGDDIWDPVYSITYVVTDLNGAIATATITVNVTATGKECIGPSMCGGPDDADCTGSDGLGMEGFYAVHSGVFWRCIESACTLCTDCPNTCSSGTGDGGSGPGAGGTGEEELDGSGDGTGNAD